MKKVLKAIMAVFMVAALVAAGKIEHRGSKKTGGYYAR